VTERDALYKQLSKYTDQLMLDLHATDAQLATLSYAP